MKKGCLIAFGAALGLVVVVLLFVFWLTRGAVSSADTFLTLIGQDKIEAAYQSSSATLRAQQSQESFAQSVQGLGLTDYASVFWSNREVKNDRAHLEGSVKTRAGGKIPLTMELVKENGGWKVIYLSAPRSGVAAEQSSKPLPPDEKSKALVLETLLAFNQAVAEKSFAGFYEQISRTWQEQIDSEKLQEIFADFIDKQIDISSIKDVEPILTEPPQIDSNGILVLQGYYPTHPVKVNFRLKYLYEHPAWKLLGIKVNVNE
jgi:hypothetical protein